MLDYVTSKDRDEIFATSLIRLVPASGDPRVVPVLLKAMKDPSPLMRSAAATGSAKRSYERICSGAGGGYRG